jgi:hypothetical protein
MRSLPGSLEFFKNSKKFRRRRVYLVHESNICAGGFVPLRIQGMLEAITGSPSAPTHGLTRGARDCPAQAERVYLALSLSPSTTCVHLLPDCRCAQYCTT